MAFAAPIAAFSATQTTPEQVQRDLPVRDHAAVPVLRDVLPDLDSLPAPLQVVAWLTPLFHGVELTRALSLGTVGGRPARRCRPRRRPARLFAIGGTSLHDPDHRASGWCADDARCRSPRPFLIGSRRSLRLVERNIYVYRHGWMVILSGFFEPLFYLLGSGSGSGALVGTVAGPGRRSRSATSCSSRPALLASAAMNGAITESTFNFFFKLNYNKTFTSILATPLSPGDIAVGELGWALIRGGLYAIGFLVVMARPRPGRRRRG